MAIFHGTAIPSGGADFYDHPIEQSLRFNDGDSAYLSWTPASAGNRRTFTISCWVKVGTLNQEHYLYTAGTGGSGWTDIFRIYGDKIQFVLGASTSPAGQLYTAQVFRDLSAWYHLVAVVDTTNATSSERMRLYVNGERVTAFDTENYPSQNYEAYYYNTTYTQAIGRLQWYGSYYFDGYLAEVHFIDGTALDASSFGETKSGVWIPKAYSGSYGTNGFYLDFGNSGSIGADVSGNGNNFTANNLAATDVVLDTPTNNFCTLNPLAKNFVYTPTLSEGNLKYQSGSAHGSTFSTFGFNSGKWYAEWRTGIGAAAANGVILESELADTTYLGSAGAGIGVYLGTNNFTIYNRGSATNGGLTITTDTVVMAAVDADAGYVWFGANGVWYGTVGNTSSGAFGLNNSAGENIFFGASYEASRVWNFGQDSSFAGLRTAQGNTDDNGYGDFYYAPPTGYLALCTANLEVPDAMNPALDNSPQDHFNTVLYTGNQGTNLNITGVGFQPDLVWGKNRSGASNHWLFDAVRGTTKMLQSDQTVVEETQSGITSFNADGFTLGTWIGSSKTNDSYVAWNWKANGSGVSNTDGSITSTVSANTDAGFSIVSYTGNETAGDTVGHGLSQAPEMLIIKRRSAAENWQIYHHAIASDAETDYLEFTTAAAADNVNRWNDTAPTSSVVTLGTHAGLNHSGSTYVMYAFHGVEGFSKFGSYTGNGSTDGTFVFTGFRPAFVLIKRTNTSGGWQLCDDARNPYNPIDERLEAQNSSAADTNTVYHIDLVSNGFKLRGTSAERNGSGDTFIYMAFAENPFKYSNAR